MKDKKNLSLSTIAMSKELHDLLVEIQKDPSKINTRTKNGYTALMMAITSNDSRMIEPLIRSGADVNIKSGKDNYTALMLATASRKDIGIINLLIENGADIDPQNDKGFTALMIAVAQSNTEIVKLLIEKKANPNLQSIDGFSALMIATKNGNPEITRILIDAGADITLKNANNDTALEIAKTSGRAEVIELLTEATNDLELKNNNQFLRLIATNPTNEQIGNFVNNHPLNFNLRDKEGKILISNLEEKYPNEFLKILEATIKNRSEREKIIKDYNKEKQKILEETRRYLPKDFAQIINKNNLNLLKVIFDENLEMKFSSTDKILEEAMNNLLAEKENEIKIATTQKKKNIKQASQKHPDFPSKKITADEAAREYIRLYSEIYNIDDALRNDLQSKIKQKFGDKILQFILDNPRKEIESITSITNPIIRELNAVEEEIIPVIKERSESEDNYKTKDDGNCLIHALTGTYNPNSKVIENEYHSLLRRDLIQYVRDNIDDLMIHAPNQTKSPIAISILDHFLTSANLHNYPPEKEYFNNHQNIFIHYKTAASEYNLAISEIIKNYAEDLYEPLNINADLQDNLRKILEKDLDYILDPNNKDVVVKYLLQNHNFRNQLSDLALEEKVINVLNIINQSENNLRIATKNAILQTLDFYKKDGVWLTADFAEIYAMMTKSNIIIYDGNINHNGEKQKVEFYYGNENDLPINIGIKGGEDGNHFERVSNIEKWLAKESEKNNFSLEKEIATEIANKFLLRYESLSLKDKQDFYDYTIGEEQNKNIDTLNSAIQSLYSKDYKLSPDSWEKIAAGVYYELISKTGELITKNPAPVIADFQAISHANIEAKYTIPSINLINSFAQKIANYEHRDLIRLASSSKTNTEIESEKDFAYYVARLVTDNYKKEFTDKFWNIYQTLDKYKNNPDKSKKNSQYLEDRLKWLEGKYEILDDKNNPLIPADLEEWKQNVINNLICKVPHYLIHAVTIIDATGNYKSLDPLLKEKIKNSKLEKWSNKDLEMSISYALSDNQDKEFVLDEIKNVLLDEEQQKAFLFKAELINSLITAQDQISALDIISYFKIANSKNKNDIERKNSNISYTITKPTEMIGREYIAKAEDIFIPSRKNPTDIKVIFTEEAKEQITKQGKKLEYWQEIANNGFISSESQKGIKSISSVNNLYELKSLGTQGNERCYAIRLDNFLFVVGYENQKGQQQNHIEKYSKYNIEITKQKEIPGNSISLVEANKIHGTAKLAMQH